MVENTSTSPKGVVKWSKSRGWEAPMRPDFEASAALLANHPSCLWKGDPGSWALIGYCPKRPTNDSDCPELGTLSPHPGAHHLSLAQLAQGVLHRAPGDLNS